MEFGQLIWEGVKIFLLIPAICLGTMLAEKKAPSKEYDERQNQARGRAYRLCFWFNLVYFGAVMIWQMNAEVFFPDAIPVYIVIFAGLLLTVMLFHTYCAITSAMFTNSLSPGAGWSTVILFVVSVGYFADFFREVKKAGGLLLPLSRENDWWIQLFPAICALYLGLLGLVQYLIHHFTREKD